MPNPLELSSLERTTFNHVSQSLDPRISLGDKLTAAFADISAKRATDDGHFSVVDALLARLAAKISAGIPVNAVAASLTITLDGAVHGDKVIINNPAVNGSDVYEFLADVAQVKSDPGNIAVNIISKTTKSSGTLTIDTQPVSGDKITIGEKTYTFVPVGTDTADGEISIESSLATAQAAIVTAINGTDGVNEPHPLVTISEFVANVATITALIGGVSGDEIATTETLTAVSNIFGGRTLGSGADCSDVDTVAALVEAINLSDTQGVSAVDGGEASCTFASDSRGGSGNSITISGDIIGEGAHLATGVDGTVGSALSILVDETNLYICLEDNAVNDANWRKIALETL